MQIEARRRGRSVFVTHDNERTGRRKKGETGCSWRFFYPTRSWVYSLVVTLLMSSVSGAFYWWYSHYGTYAHARASTGGG